RRRGQAAAVPRHERLGPGDAARVGGHRRALPPARRLGDGARGAAGLREDEGDPQMTRHLVEPGTKVRLKDHNADDTGDFRDKAEAETKLQRDVEKLADLQERLYAENKRALLVVLQAMDTGGKDGTIKHVMSGCNPTGCTVT